MESRASAPGLLESLGLRDLLREDTESRAAGERERRSKRDGFGSV